MGITLIRISVHITRKLDSPLPNQFWLIAVFCKPIDYNPYLPKQENATLEFDLFKDDTLKSKYTHYNVWGEINYPYLNFNGATVEV